MAYCADHDQEDVIVIHYKCSVYLMAKEFQKQYFILLTSKNQLKLNTFVSGESDITGLLDVVNTITIIAS